MIYLPNRYSRFLAILVATCVLSDVPIVTAQQLYPGDGQGCSSCGSAGLVGLAPVGCSTCNALEPITHLAPASQARPIASLYNRYCVRCHGVDGRGVCDFPGVPDFTNLDWQSSRTDEQISRLTYEGRGALMPAFRGTLTRDESCEMAQYIRRFASQPMSQQYGVQSYPAPIAAQVTPMTQMVPQTTSTIVSQNATPMLAPYSAAPAPQVGQSTPQNSSPNKTQLGGIGPTARPSIQKAPSTSTGDAAPTNIPSRNLSPATPTLSPTVPGIPFDDFISPTELDIPQTGKFLNLNNQSNLKSKSKLPVVSGPADQIVIVRPDIPDTSAMPKPPSHLAVRPDQGIQQPLLQKSQNFNLQPPSSPAFPLPVQSPVEPPTKETFMPFQLVAPESGGHRQMSFGRQLPTIERPSLLPVYPETQKSLFRNFSADYPMSEN